MSMDEKIEIKIFNIALYYIFCIMIYIIWLISIIILIIYYKNIFSIITPNFLWNLYIKYNWLEQAHFFIIFIIYSFLLFSSMDFSRKYFEKKCVFYFYNNQFKFFVGKKQYSIDVKNNNLKCYKKAAFLPIRLGDLNYYKIIIFTEKGICKINTQIIKSMDSITNTSKLIEKLKEYYGELNITE
jgi:hypothetical protein